MKQMIVLLLLLSLVSCGSPRDSTVPVSLGSGGTLVPSLTIEDLQGSCPNLDVEGKTLRFSGTQETFSSDGSVTVDVGGLSKVVSYNGVTGRGTILEATCWNDLGDVAVWVKAY